MTYLLRHQFQLCQPVFVAHTFPTLHHSIVALLCSLFILSISICYWGLHSGMQYSRCGTSSALFLINKLSITSRFIVLTILWFVHITLLHLLPLHHNVCSPLSFSRLLFPTLFLPELFSKLTHLEHNQHHPFCILAPSPCTFPRLNSICHFCVNWFSEWDGVT